MTRTRGHRSPGSEVRRRLATAVLVASVGWSGSARAAAPHVVKGPYLTGLGDDAVDVRFELDAPAPATVQVWADGEKLVPAKSVTDAPGTMHDVRVAGLRPTSAYRYDVSAGEGPPQSGDFVTAPANDSTATVTFLVYGDVRSDVAIHAALVQRMQETPSDFLVNTGDVVADGGSAADWDTFFRIEGPLLRRRPLFLAIGNHELYDDQAGSSFARYFGYPDATGAVQPYGTMRWGDVRMFFLNGMHDWSTGPERAWLEKALADADHEPGLVWRFVVVHHSPWASGPHGGNPKLLDAHVPELLAAHGVDMLFGGHDHIYERGEAQLKYVISGGGGAKLYDIAHRLGSTRKAESAYHFVAVTVSPTSLKLVARRVDGTVLDECGFEKGKSWDCDPPPGAAPTTSGASAASLPEPHTTTTTRCGCALPGSSTGPSVAELFAAVALGLAALRRRRG